MQRRGGNKAVRNFSSGPYHRAAATGRGIPPGASAPLGGKFPGTFERHVDVGADVLGAQHVDDSRSFERHTHLLVHTRQHYLDFSRRDISHSVVRLCRPVESMKGTLRMRMTRTFGRSPIWAISSSNLVAMPKK